jgi:hypothetical protein
MTLRNTRPVSPSLPSPCSLRWQGTCHVARGKLEEWSAGALRPFACACGNYLRGIGIVTHFYHPGEGAAKPTEYDTPP